MTASSPAPAQTFNQSRVAIIVAAALLAATLAYIGSRAFPSEPVTSASLRRVITVANVMDHLRALDRIADAEGGTRFTGTEGYEKSVTYVERRLEEAGLEVRRESFPFYSFRQRSPTTLRIVSGRAFEDGTDVKAMTYSASGDVSARLVAISFERVPGDADGPGCRSGAFTDEAVEGSVVLLRPGPCLYRDQVRNAQDAGAVAVIFAFGPASGQDRLLRPTLFTPEGIDIPALGVRDEIGLQLLESVGSRVELRTDIARERTRADNLVAETKSGDGDRVIMVGAHLDSVLDGPGVNDNGSGVAAVLELARRLGELRTENKVRFAFWGGEEIGLLGSTAYVGSLSGAERSSIAAYLNFDMVGSPNYARYVYSAESAPPGSGELAELLFDYFDDHTLPAEELDLQGRSDHGPFIQAGIPVGGLFTGAEDAKTAAEANLYGGVAGRPHDGCYHQACDTIANVNREVLDQMADAIAHAVATLAEAEDPP